jgi:N-acyl-D-aspartate/D-glutamate deacylase
MSFLAISPEKLLPGTFLLRWSVPTRRRLIACLAAALPGAALAHAQAPAYDVVIQNGRVIDPESGLDAVRSLGIRGGRIAAVSGSALRGRLTIDARGLVVAPGFIDLHVHGQNDENYRVYAMDGVTTALELEVGVGDVPAFYSSHDGKALINYGASAGHIRARMAVLHDGGTARGTLLPLDSAGHNVASDVQIGEIRNLIETGLAAGALGVGMGLEYTPAATRYEVLEAFRAAARYRAPVFVHTRATGASEPGSSIESYLEVIGASAITGAPVHIVHLNSTSLAMTPRTLALIREARAHGLDVTTEAYPYAAGMTELASPLLDRYANGPDSMFAKLMLVSTGERLTRATFTANRTPGSMVILFLNTPEMEALAVTSPLTAIASDGFLLNGKGHPRTAGTSGRVLGHYVRETRQLGLVEAIRKLALMPAQRLERRAPMFRNKGRIKVGADADITVFDPATVADRSTYQQPALPSVGFRYVLVNGVPVVAEGVLKEGLYPGRPARAPIGVAAP